MSKILFLTFYFEPDLCAGSFRNTPLVYALEKKISENDEIIVVTTMPNRYISYKEQADTFEKKGRVSIYRIPLPEHTSGMKDQARSFSKFYREALRIADKNKFDMVFASSSRLFTAYLGAKISRKHKVPLYLDIRDIFKETIVDIVKQKAMKVLLHLSISKIENYAFSRARHINLVSEGFRLYFSKYKRPEFTYFTNGIDEVFLNQAVPEMIPGPPFIITYAGNIGEGQGLHKVLPGMAKELGTNYIIRIIGDGGAMNKFKEAIEKGGVRNIELLPPGNRKMLIDNYNKSHFLFVHLNDLAAFEKVLPSKIFEYACFNKPIIAGVSGYARTFIIENVDNVILFDPCDFLEAAAKIRKYHYHTSDRANFIQKFSRSEIMDKMSASVLKLIGK